MPNVSHCEGRVSDEVQAKISQADIFPDDPDALQVNKSSRRQRNPFQLTAQLIFFGNH